jgi:hypothetical protein
MTRVMRLIAKLCFVVAVTGLCASGLAADSDRTVLKHDDGTMESKLSMTGGGHAILFQTPEEGEWYLTGITLFGARYGHDRAPDEDFLIYVADASMESFCRIPKPYALFAKGLETWTEIDLPPVKVPGSFYVCLVFNPTQTKGVYVGMDEGVAEAHSKNAVPGSHTQDLETKADWMIRAFVSRTAEGEALVLLNKEGREKQREVDVAARDAQLLKGAKKRILRHDDGEMDNHQSYGGPTAQTTAYEAPPGDWYVYGISLYGSQYGGKHDSEAVNGDVYILDKDLRVVSRTPFPYSLLTYRKAWVEVATLPTRVQGKFYVAVHAHSERYKGIYVGYDEDIETSHSNLGGASSERFTLRPTKTKLEWMIRPKLAGKPVYYE